MESSGLPIYERRAGVSLKTKEALLDGFQENGAITRAQHDKSLHDLIEKMGEK